MQIGHAGLKVVALTFATWELYLSAPGHKYTSLSIPVCPVFPGADMDAGTRSMKRGGSPSRRHVPPMRAEHRLPRASARTFGRGALPRPSPYIPHAVNAASAAAGSSLIS